MISISYEELAARLLAEVRRQPGCGGVTDVSIIRITDEGGANNWAVGDVSCGSVTPNTLRGRLSMRRPISSATSICSRTPNQHMTSPARLSSEVIHIVHTPKPPAAWQC